MQRRLRRSVAVICLSLPPVLSSGVALPQSVYTDWQSSYQFPSATHQQVNLNRAHLIALKKGGFFDRPHNTFNTTIYQKQFCQVAGSCQENNATSIGNLSEVTVTHNCSGGATCETTVKDGAVVQNNDHSSQSSQTNTGNKVEGCQGKFVNC